MTEQRVAMNQRLKITRLDEQNNPLLTLVECQAYFAQQPDFVYRDAFGASQNGVNMKIAGHFFMWQVEQVEIPFRFYEGEIYVAISHPAILDRAAFIAEQLQAQLMEG